MTTHSTASANRPQVFRVRWASPGSLGLGSGLGQSSGLDICKLIPVDGALKSLVSQYGCLPASKALLSAKIAEMATPAPTKLGAKTETPGWAQILAYATPEIIAECLCKGQGTAQIPYYPTPRPVTWYENPLVVGGVIIGGILLTLSLTKKKET